MRASRRLRAALPISFILLAILAASAWAGLPTPACGPCSTVPPALILGGKNSLGGVDPGATFTIVVRDLANYPIPFSLVELDFGACSGVRVCSVQPDPDLTVFNCAQGFLAKYTDVSGTASFRILGAAAGLPGGACSTAGCAKVYADGVLIRQVNVATPDLDGVNGVGPADLSVWLNLFFAGTYCGQADFDGSGKVSASDLSWWLNYHFLAGSTQSCGSSTCP
jgi:hypothetical protein